jgi:hypothetical protein
MSVVILLLTPASRLLAQNLVRKPDFGVTGNPAVGGTTAAADFITQIPSGSIANNNTYAVVSSYTNTTSSATPIVLYDHTLGGTPGLFLAVNGPATNTPNNVVWQQTLTVQPGQNYTFSYWQRNLVTTAPATLQLDIQGNSSNASVFTPTNTPSTSSTTGLGWVLITTPTFNSGINTQVTIKLSDTNFATGGNFFGLDDMSLNLQGANAGTITGTVFEDVNYGGGVGRPLSTATNSASTSGLVAAITRPRATVELYNAAGTLAGTTTTNGNGLYTFQGVVAGTYTVRVVSSTVTSARTGGTTSAGLAAAGLLPVVTYQNGTIDQVGGPNPALPDAPANTTGSLLALLTTTAQAVEAQSTVTVSGSATTSNVDFGFNFDLVVNTKNTGQGSLRQFITNANALGNEASLAQAGFYRNQLVGANPLNEALPLVTESSIFMIPSGTAAPGLRAANASGPASQLNSSGVAEITPSAALPTITGPKTAINGWTQSYNLGNTNDVVLGAGGTVGTTGTLLSQLNGPEVQLTGSSTIAFGLDVTGTGTSLTGLAIYGFGTTTTNVSDANIRSAADNVTIGQNVLGSAATAFAAPVNPTNASNIRLLGGAGIMLMNNLIGFSNGKGITISSGVVGTTITGNEVRSNGQSNATYGGLDIQGSGANATYNLFINNIGPGIDSNGSAGSNVITDNSITSNGRGNSSFTATQTPGIRILGADNTVARNTISNNYGAGVLLVNTASTTTISQNAIFGNGSVTSSRGTAASGEIGIDLTTSNDSNTAGTTPFVTLNNSTTTGTNANGLVNYPILQMARLNGNNLVISGLAVPGVTVEVFAAQANPASLNASGANFGQGSVYIGSAVVSSSGTTGTYSSTVNGFAQGSGTNVNYFIISISLNNLSPAQRAALTTGVLVTSTATLGNATSEFSGNVAITNGPSAFNVSNLNVGANATATILNPNLSVPQAASDPASTITSFTVYPAQNGGTLAYNGVAIPAAGRVVPIGNTHLLTFTPTASFTGSTTFLFTATNTAGVVSNQAVYTIPVVTSSNGFVANDDGLDAPQNTATAGNVVLNDTNANNTTNFTATLIASPTHGTLTLLADGSYTYTSASGYLGSDSFQYQVCTGSPAVCSNVATVSINVYNPTLVCNAATGPNLLVNPDFEQGNQSFTSAYTYVPRPASAATSNPNGLYPESRYTVDNDANYYHGSFTGKGRGGNGKFMIVNGDANQSQIYVQVVTVVPDRYYSFSGYAQSVNAVSPAVLGFVINGKSASVSTKLPTTVGQYVQFSGVWYSGTSRTATFEVRDINRDAGGNDFGLDDLYFGTCNVNLSVSNIMNPSVSSQAATTNLDAMHATFTGTGVSIASLMIRTLPTAGTLRLGGATGTVVTAGQIIPYDQREALYYAPVSNSAGDVSFTYSAIDSEGAGSGNIATFTIPVTAAPLPVTLRAFTVHAVGSAAQLDWATASEKQNAYFVVERSLTGRTDSFLALGQVAGHGSVITTSTYHFTDAKAAAAGQLVYYRLRQVDEDGTSTYSPVRTVAFAPVGIISLSVYPNPTVGSSTSLDLSALPATATYQVRLLDATGRTARQWQLAGGQPQALDVATLASGTYLLLVSGTRPDGTPLRQVLHLTKE